MHLLPTWDEFNDKQREVFDHPLNQSLFAVGPPGSGKTTLALHRAALLTSAGQTVAIITFNRMLRRLAKLLSTSEAKIATMHSFASRDYAKRTGEGPPKDQSDPYAYIWAEMLEKLEGHPSSGPSLDHLIIDEGQDLPKGFFQYAAKHIAPAISVFADENQAIGGRISTLSQIRDATGLSSPTILQENYRNTPEIARLAEHFHRGRVPAATVHRSSLQEHPKLICSASATDTARRIATWFQNRGGTLGVVVQQNDTGDKVYTELRRLLPKRRVDIYKSKNRDEESIELLKAGVTVLNMESAKGQEFDTLFILELEKFIPCGNVRMRRVMYMLCARARDHLWLVHGPGNLSPQAEASLPGDLLQRVV